jgi:hypothetical protein
VHGMCCISRIALNMGEIYGRAMFRSSNIVHVSVIARCLKTVYCVARKEPIGVVATSPSRVCSGVTDHVGGMGDLGVVEQGCLQCPTCSKLPTCNTNRRTCKHNDVQFYDVRHCSCGIVRHCVCIELQREAHPSLYAHMPHRQKGRDLRS